MKTLFLTATLFLSLSSFAGSKHDHPAPALSPAFESLKSIVGVWEGTNKMSGKEEPMKVTYELTSGGTAIVEKLMPGTPHEMVTVYANRGKEVHATHFCMLGNQPVMKLKKAAGNQFVFEMDGTKGISNKNEMHMHGVTLALNGNKLKQEWTNYKDNKKGDVVVFELTKKN